MVLTKIQKSTFLINTYIDNKPESITSSVIKQDNEVKYLHIQSTWNHIQQKKESDLRWIESLYHKQELVMDKVQTIRDTLKDLHKEQEEAVVSEDFQRAQQLAQQIETSNKNIEYLVYDQFNELTQEIRAGWEKLIRVLERELGSAESVVQYGQLVEQERTEKLNKFIADINLIHTSKIQDIEKRRQHLETAKR